MGAELHCIVRHRESAAKELDASRPKPYGFTPARAAEGKQLAHPMRRWSGRHPQQAASASQRNRQVISACSKQLAAMLEWLCGKDPTRSCLQGMQQRKSSIESEKK